MTYLVLENDEFVEFLLCLGDLLLWHYRADAYDVIGHLFAGSESHL